MVVQEDDCNLLVSGHSKKGCRQAAEAEDVTDRNSAITAVIRTPWHYRYALKSRRSRAVRNKSSVAVCRRKSFCLPQFKAHPYYCFERHSS